MKPIKLRKCISCNRKFKADGFRKCGPCNLKCKVNKIMAEHDRNRKALKSSGLCDRLVPGCTCNQSGSIGE